MYQFRFEAEFVDELIVFKDSLGSDDRHFSASVCQIDQAFISKHELYLLSIRYQISLAQRGIGFQPQLRRVHHRSDKGVPVAFHQFRRRRQRRRHDPREPFGRDHLRQRPRDLLLHSRFVNELFQILRLAFCLRLQRLFLRGDESALFRRFCHDYLSLFRYFKAESSAVFPLLQILPIQIGMLFPKLCGIKCFRAFYVFPRDRVAAVSPLCTVF